MWFRIIAFYPKRKGGHVMAFLASFLQYFIIMVILAAVAVAGVFTGKKLRDNKDAKKAAETAKDVN